jgi:hypothetical protein
LAALRLLLVLSLLLPLLPLLLQAPSLRSSSPMALKVVWIDDFFFRFLNVSGKGWWTSKNGYSTTTYEKWVDGSSRLPVGRFDCSNRRCESKVSNVLETWNSGAKDFNRHWEEATVKYFNQFGKEPQFEWLKVSCFSVSSFFLFLIVRIGSLGRRIERLGERAVVLSSRGRPHGSRAAWRSQSSCRKKGFESALFLKTLCIC